MHASVQKRCLNRLVDAKAHEYYCSHAEDEKQALFNITRHSCGSFSRTRVA